MKQLLLISSLLLTLLACNKDKFETKPSLKVESLSNEFVSRNQDLNVMLSFSDKEGDVDDSLYVIRTRTNRRGPFTQAKATDYKIPDFPDQQSGEISLRLPYSLFLTAGLPSISIPSTSKKEPDTLVLKFVLKDKAKNVSDTAFANVIVERF